MIKHNSHIHELASADFSVAMLGKPATEFDKDDIKSMIYSTQEHSDMLYVAYHDSFDVNSGLYSCLKSYTEFLKDDIDTYVARFNEIKRGAKTYFHQEMTLGYFIDLYISFLHRKFENHQDDGSLVMINSNGQEI
ncbi:hypothetical protein [Apilactobacillus xinyiensis]|uniref:Uncharacterized protein n=1 Tax=Apilactobacillus xinyiensis TaxID=2841032 RepID=A0ABT0I2H6_9LACO|nr:hypothetical protein [Apilactobacillus xinyiensis]MCK8624925.1 hypothetical protein [Apilactobacillus xinyiensis]MCL0312611.1 hypothetical protein [Apilactobacillus xinyiensis]MCL0319006.1 hypothetical protein [Apilactobacillus xinyiensis]